ncbi:MAG: hypothetical protein PVH61_29190 [Candidatus Aminicenantes bacterium]|jgi:hypothetical protein
MGTHRELLSNCDLYSDLCEKQFKAAAGTPGEKKMTTTLFFYKITHAENCNY